MNENNEKKFDWKPFIIAGIISLIIGISIFCLVVFAFKKAYVDGAAFATLTLVSSGVLIWVAREGFFDFASYGFRQFGNALFSKKPNEYNDFAGYKNYKQETRKNRPSYFFSLLVVGGVFLVATIIFFIIYKL